MFTQACAAAVPALVLPGGPLMHRAVGAYRDLVQAPRGRTVTGSCDRQVVSPPSRREGKGSATLSAGFGAPDCSVDLGERVAVTEIQLEATAALNC